MKELIVSGDRQKFHFAGNLFPICDDMDSVARHLTRNYSTIYELERTELCLQVKL